MKYFLHLVMSLILVSSFGHTASAATVYSASPNIHNKKSQLELNFQSSGFSKVNLHQNKYSVFIQFPGSQFQGDMLSLLSLQERFIPFLPDLQNITVAQTLPSGQPGLYINLQFKGPVHASLNSISPLKHQVLIKASSPRKSKKYVPRPHPTFTPPPSIPEPYINPPITLNLPGPIRPQIKPPGQKVFWKIAELNSVQNAIARYRTPDSKEHLTKLHWKQAFNLSKHKWHFINKHQKITNHKYIQLGPGETLKLTHSNIAVNLRDVASVDLNGSIIDLHQGWMYVEGKLPNQNNYQFKVHPEYTPLTITSYGVFSFMASPDHIIVLKGYIDVNDTHHSHAQNSLKLAAGSHLDLKTHKVNQLTARQLNKILVKSSFKIN